MIQKKWFFFAFVFTLALGIGHIWSPGASAQSSYFSSRGCVDCHATPVAATCAGCHQHSGSLTATTNKSSYAAGETVTVTLTSSGARSGWIGARLYNQSGAEVARSTGNQSGMGGSTLYPAVLSAPAPTAAGTYTWKMAYLGNQNGSGSGDVHSEKSVNVTFSVSAPAPAVDATAPVVGAFTLPATSTSLTVPVSSFTATDNVAVTGYLINKSATKPAATAAGWTAAKPTSVTAVAGSNTFYAWARDAAGNVSSARSATVTVTVSSADTTPPTLNVSALADGAATNKSTLNVSGNVTDAGGIKSVTVNGQAVVVNAGSFSTALNLVAGANVVTVVATDNAGNQATNSRTITYDLAVPVLTVSAPADNSTSAQSFVTVSGSVSENSTVTVKVNAGSPQSAAMNGTGFSATVNLASGINTIDIAATDLAGNVASAKRTVTYSVAPQSRITLAVTNPAQDVTTSSSSMTIRGTVKDAAGSIRVTVKVNDRTYYPSVGSTGSFSQSVTFSEPRTYVINVTARDGAGNTATVTRNVIYRSYDSDDDDDSSSGSTTSHPFGWTSPRSSHDEYVERNGVSGCVSCHSVDPASKGQPMSCYNCHGQEWSSSSTGGGTDGGSTTSHPFGWTNPRDSHDNYLENNSVSNCTSCHSINSASKGQPLSCYNCHGQEWDTPSTGGGTSGGTTTSHPFGWTDPEDSHDSYVERNGVSSCTSCHSTSSDSEGPMSCYNCHGREW